MIIAILLETREVNLLPFYIMMIGGAAGLIAVALYIVYSILKYVKKRKESIIEEKPEG